MIGLNFITIKKGLTMENLWKQTGGNMQKLDKTTAARLVKAVQGWYIIWYDRNATPYTRYREKFNLNRIKDLTVRQMWADKILLFINGSLVKGTAVNIGQIDNAVTTKNTQLIGEKTAFETHVLEFIDMRKTLFSKGTIKTMENTKRLLGLFAKDVLKKEYPDFEDFDANFPIRFKTFCFASPRNHSINYVAKRLDHIKRFLTDAAVSEKVHVNILWTSEKYKVKKVDVDDISLTIKELETLNALHLEGEYKAVRDLFLFASLTGGLRFSDFSTIQDSDFVTMESEGRAVKMVKVTTKKTHDKVIVPLHPIALEILERNGGTLPQCTVNQVFNRYIKTICQKAGFTEMVSLRKNVSGKTRTVKVAKYDCVTAHTARRNFATIGFTEWKVPISILMSITGHATEQQFFAYIKLKKEFAAVELTKYMNRLKP